MHVLPKNLLIVSRYFAPSPAVGAKRFSYLCREFERLGIRVHVLTGALEPGEVPDDSLPRAGSVTRCEPLVHLPIRGYGGLGRTVNRLARRLLEPIDMSVFWIGRATRMGRKLAAELGNGAIIATLPPPSAALVGIRIARSTGWPLVLDYRDPWAAYPWARKLRGRASRTVAEWLESRCVAASAARVFNTPEMRSAFETYYPETRSERHFVIPNGLDLASPAHVSTNSTTPSIVHAGTIYGDRSLLPLLRALAKLRSTRPDLEPVNIVVYGEVHNADLARIRSERLQHLIDVRPRVPRAELESKLRSALALLVVSGGQMPYSIPYKVYDYLAARRPIIAISDTRSALARFMREQGLGEHATPDSQDAVLAALDRVLSHAQPSLDEHTIEAHRWSKLAQDYVSVLAQLEPK